ncbi:tail completion protein gp17 [Aureimonas leprariae]|uniref:DUF3168 domain-containing protein n=1 Tax=Plantimonas leprariae TaxID=2615207 RepID=A0A7V7TWE6_9HYPH|nr:DUF3168 domain-containing protein [Aureimonas leprariae]KAB0679525.1 DUF3168 domain-containing protein [Aureimonas leprariae]
MIEPSLELQRAIRARLVATPAVVALVDQAQIRDGFVRPESFPSILIGDGQTVLERVTYARRHVRTYADLHVFTHGEGLAGAKTVAAAVAGALATAPAIDGFRMIDFEISGVRYLRDPDHEAGHAVVSVEALVEAVQ